MSEKTHHLVERVGRLFEAANRRDFDAAMSFYAPDGVWKATDTSRERRQGDREAYDRKARAVVSRDLLVDELDVKAPAQSQAQPESHGLRRRGDHTSQKPVGHASHCC
jgi:ketosteroid isomerase-like protein